MENEPVHTEEVLTESVRPFSERAQELGRSVFCVYAEAEIKVKAEHPHWFVEYPDRKRIDAKRRQKMDARSKKASNAIRAEVALLLNGLPEAILREGIEEQKVIIGIASAESEVTYLEEALLREPEHQQ